MEWQNIDWQITQFSEHTATTEKSNFRPFSQLLLERLRNEDEDKTKTQMTQSFNQYSENETTIWRQNILNQFNHVSSSCLRSHFRNLSVDMMRSHANLILVSSHLPTSYLTKHMIYFPMGFQ